MVKLDYLNFSFHEFWIIKKFYKLKLLFLFMFEQFISNDYLRAFLILLIGLFVIRIILTIIERTILKLTSKTKTKTDDLLVEALSNPLTFLAFTISFWFAFGEINLAENLTTGINSLIHTFLVIILAKIIYRIFDILLIKSVKKVAKRTKTRLDDTLISLFSGTLKFALIIITLLYIMSLWGIEIGPFLAGLGIAGIAVALALQPILSNIFSGAAMIFDQTIRVKDLVYLDGNVKGKIEKIGLRSTRIRTFDNEYIIVPNNKLADSMVQNIALPDPKSRAVVPFSVAYGSDVDKVKELILKTLKTIKLISKEEKIVVRFLEMADSSLNFKAYFFVDSFEDRISAIDQANTKIYNTLNKAKIEIPFPKMDIHLKK
jgi:small-conductance mechanosensitive channel